MGKDHSEMDGLKQLGDNVAEAMQKEALDWETVSSSAYASLDNVTKSDITECKSFKAPPTYVITVLVAVTICLGEVDVKDWAGARKALQDPCFLKRLKDFGPSPISANMLKRLKPIVETPEFLPEKVR